jgi:hypothetical protein
LIEDARALWTADLFAELAQRGYTVVSRSKLNVMLRRTAHYSLDPDQSAGAEVAGSPSASR